MPRRLKRDRETVVVRLTPDDGVWTARLIEPDDYPGESYASGPTPGAALEALVGIEGANPIGVVIDRPIAKDRSTQKG